MLLSLPTFNLFFFFFKSADIFPRVLLGAGGDRNGQGRQKSVSGCAYY